MAYCTAPFCCYFAVPRPRPIDVVIFPGRVDIQRGLKTRCLTECPIGVVDVVAHFAILDTVSNKCLIGVRDEEDDLIAQFEILDTGALRHRCSLTRARARALGISKCPSVQVSKVLISLDRSNTSARTPIGHLRDTVPSELNNPGYSSRSIAPPKLGYVRRLRELNPPGAMFCRLRLLENASCERVGSGLEVWNSNTCVLGRGEKGQTFALWEAAGASDEHEGCFPPLGVETFTGVDLCARAYRFTPSRVIQSSGVLAEHTR